MSGMIGSASKTLRVKEFRSSGTFTVPAGVKTVDLIIGGGGSAGAATTTAGTGGQVVKTRYDVSGKATCAVVIGAGGVQPSNPGGDSSFDGVVIAKGGKGYGFAAGPTFNATVDGLGQPGSKDPPAIGGASYNDDAAANSCAGGGVAKNGGSGYCRVEWYE